MTTRRKFIQSGSLLAASLMAGNAFGASKKLSKDVGLQLYTVRDEIKDLENTIKQISMAGYNNLELYGYDKRMFFGKTVKEFSELLKKNNLKTASGHYALSDMLYDEKYNWDSWKYLLEDAKTLGNKYVVIPHIDDKHRSADYYKFLAERLNKGGELSKAAGLTTAYHNHNFEFVKLGNTCGYEILLKNTDPKLVKFEMDLYWVTYAEEKPAEWFAKYPGRFPMWHIKDMEKETAGKPKGQTCEVGKGIIDWKSIFAKQSLAGLEYAFVEQEQYRHPVFECIKTSADYMKKNLL
jgi:sugar phosphate isomerase/epimerase